MPASSPLSAAEFQMAQALPDLDNRSPSLADYVGDVLEPRVLELLWGLCRPGTNDQVAAEPLRVVHPMAGGGARRWDRTWKIYDHTGVIVQVAVEVHEGRDPEVDIKVGRTLVGRGVPPGSTAAVRGCPRCPRARMPPSVSASTTRLWEGAPAQIMAEVEQSRNMVRYSGR